jgi:hypothetical protein
MTARSVIAARHHQALTELATILERHDREAAARLAKTNHGAGVPTSPKRPLESATYMVESLLILAQILDERLAPKRRGRPPKAAQSRGGSHGDL